MDTIVHQFPHFGDVYLASFDGDGSVQQGVRPALIFQNDVGNLHSPNVVVLPLTSRIKRRELPTHVLVKAEDSGLAMDSIVLCENPQCIPKSRLGAHLAHIPDHYMQQVAVSSALASAAIGCLDYDALVDLWHRASALNHAAGEERRVC